jgi:hypothetical protein
MLLRDARGIEGLPVVLIIGTVLGACVLGISAKALTNVQNIVSHQHAIRSFDSLVEKARHVSFGGPGSWQCIELELPSGKITVDGKLLQLLIDSEARRVEVLPLPMLMGGQSTFELKSGWYVVELCRVSRELAQRDNLLREGEFYLGVRSYHEPAWND